MANLLDFEDDDIFNPKATDLSTTNKSIDEILAANQSMSQSADLDSLLRAQPSGMLSPTDDLDSLDPFTGAMSPTEASSSGIDDFFAPKPKHPLDQKKMDDLFGSSEDDFDFFAPVHVSSNSLSQPAALQNTPSSVEDFFDSLMKSDSNQLESRNESSDKTSQPEPDDIFDLLMTSDSNQLESRNESHDRTTSQPEPDDIFDLLMTSDSNQLESRNESRDKTSQPEPEVKSHDPFGDLDFLMQAQPSGEETVASSVGLPTQTNTAHFSQSPADTQPDPLDDFFSGSEVTDITSAAKNSADEEEANLEADDINTTLEPATEVETKISEELSTDEKVTTLEEDDLGITQEPHSQIEAKEPHSEAKDLRFHATPGKLTKLSKKRSMERSFEDLLQGLSEDSDPDLDDMLVSDDNNYSTNLESLLDTPDKIVHHFSTPAKPPTSLPLFEMEPEADIPKLEPPDIAEDEECETEVTGVKNEPPEVMVHTPVSDDEDVDIKSWEMVTREEDVAEDENNSARGDEVVMRRGRTSSHTESMDGDDVDLSAIEDTNHLDVDVNKQKSALSKKGSFALRRKPSRKNRRSLLPTDDDDLFKDTTEPKLPTRTDDDEDERFDVRDERDSLSPPAKRPSPSGMVPLPGLSRHLSYKEQKMVDDSRTDRQDNEIPVETKRLSKPPPGAFRLPTVMPRPGRPKPDTDSKTGSDEESHIFDKPPLKSVTRTAVSEIESETKTFERPALKNVAPQRQAVENETTERDMTFDVPRLRSMPKPKQNNNADDIKGDFTTGMFSRPSLRSTPKHKPSIEKQEIDPTSDFDMGRLADTPKRRPESDKESTDETKYIFEKPVLKSSTSEKKDPISTHIFEKPALRSQTKTSKDSKQETTYIPTGTFDKPSLRKSISPDKVTKDTTEAKGVFDKPVLRKADVREEKSSNYGSFPELKLRKTRSPSEEPKEVEKEKPAWLQTAMNKQTKAQKIINYKENQSTSTEKSTPAWLQKNQLNKVPLQESNSQSEGSILKPTTTTTKRSMLSRGSSQGSGTGSENESGDREKGYREKPKTVTNNNYQPSWMRNAKPSHNPAAMSGMLGPARSCPALDSPDEMPSWKRELAQRRQRRKDSPILTDVPKKEESAEPEWKKNVALRKLRPTANPSRDTNTVEPEWKKAAEEKRARLRNSVLYDNDDSTAV